MILAAPIAGINFRPSQVKDHIRTLSTGDPLHLEHETDNPHDRLAIKIFSDEQNGRRHFIGYVSANSSSTNNVKFHEHQGAWETARFIRNKDSGEARVGIEVEG